MNATDQEVSAVLKAIREAAPGVIEQAVTYYQFLFSAWLGAMLLVAGISTVVFWQCRKRWGDYNADSHRAAAVVSVIVGCIALLISAGVATQLVKISIAPDYFAAECITELGHKALGH